MLDAKETAGLAALAAGAPPPSKLVRLALALYGALLLAAIVWRFAVDGVLPWGVGSESSPAWSLTVRALAGISLGAALIGVSHVWTARTESGRRLAAELEALVAGVRPRQAILLALLSGCAEEAFFRGALQPRVGWVAASLLFGVAHFHPRRELRVWSVSAGLAGLTLGWLFEASGDLLAPLLAHSLVNAVNLTWLAKRGASERATLGHRT